MTPAMTRYRHALPRVASLLLLVLLVGETTAIIRRATIASDVVPPANSRETAAPAKEVDLAAIRRARLFDDATTETPKSPASSAATAVKSPLDIRLLGTVRSPQGQDSVAILAESGRQRVYASGETLKQHADARLIEISAQRILLDVAGERQYIELETAK